MYNATSGHDTKVAQGHSERTCMGQHMAAGARRLGAWLRSWRGYPEPVLCGHGVGWTGIAAEVI